ncbi:uncharacterized protein BCR38DRAFT_418058 [Pseudomassariella vexata]|uniref:Uncharacterized protein n=1 Tax=Pseudomassariella vexata TaxID=1141098 RepID=A0A1Y2ELQ3_9PEZI|nr:uncharacterized protein BCR38DRAFT_418058 [Pseudomassariella vexata]ORY71785.1 hypothetical protein BCR38DRAFT_418058 [Pseudomassariella vexata]
MDFPAGLNLDHIAAHFSPNASNETNLQLNNVMKVDIGVHVNGCIIDGAFTRLSILCTIIFWQP